MFPRWLPTPPTVFGTAFLIAFGVAPTLSGVAPGLSGTGTANAEEPAQEPLKLAAGTVRTLELPEDVRTVVIGTPAIGDASAVTHRKLLLFGKRPGSTTLLVLDTQGQTLLNTTLIVTPLDQGLVTIDRGIKETNLTCSPRCAVSIGSSSGAEAEAASAPPPAPGPSGTGGPPPPSGEAPADGTTPNPALAPLPSTPELPSAGQAPAGPK